MSDDNYDVIVPASAAKWFGIIAGLLLPVALGVMAGNIYGSNGAENAQVFPLPED